jgi:hypothetical protein
MTAPSQRWRDQQADFSAFLSRIRQTADDLEWLSHPEIGQRIDEVHRVLVAQFLPLARDHAELTRLSGKLEALRERLLYSYFGPAELRSLRELLYDLRAIIDQPASGDEIDLALVDRPFEAAHSGSTAPTV